MDRRTLLMFVVHVVLVATVVFAGLYIVSFELPFTGLLSFDKNVTVSIQPEQDGEISHFSFDQVITIGNSTFVNLELTNTGSTVISGTYDLEVYDINNSLLYTYPGPTRTLQPGSFMKRTVKHTPHEVGTYIIRLRGVMGGDVLQTAKFLVVQEEPEPPDPEPTVITRTRVRYVYGPAPPEPEPPTRGWRVEAPRTIDLAQGGSTTLPIRITNTGEAVLRNVRLSVRSSRNITVAYDPKIMFGILSNETRNFMLTLTGDNTTREDQSISYTVSSDELSREGETEVNIVPAVTIAQLRDELAKLQLLVQDAEDEMRRLEGDGVAVPEARASLEEVRVRITEANTSIEEENLREAKNRIDSARSQMGEVFQKLFKKRSEQLVVTAPLVRPVYLLMLAAILIAVVMVGGYYYIRERHEERPKLLRDLEEEEG